MGKVVTGASLTEATNAFKLIVAINLLNESIKGLSVFPYVLATPKSY